jgi:hypothetical protein
MALNASASSGSTLGFGMEFYLIDNFSKVANRIKASMASLNQAANNNVKNQINANRLAISNQNLMAARQRTIAATHNATASNSRRFLAQYAATGAKLKVQNQQANQANQNQILAQRNAYWQQRTQQTQQQTANQAQSATNRNALQQAQLARLQQQTANQQISFQQRQLALSNRQAAAMQNFQVGYNRMMSGFSAIGGGAIFAAPVMYAIQMAGTFEQATVRLETLLKSKDKAMAFFNDLKGDALKLPNVEVLDLLKGVGDLIAGGENAQTARGVMRDLANVVMATGGGQPQFQRASFNLAQIRNNGFASMRDIREFSTANIPLISLLKKKGIDVSKTKATYEQIISVLADYAKENNVAEKMLNSISGQTAMFKENMKYLFADMGESLKPFYVGLMKYLNGTINSLREFTGSSFGKFILRGAMLVLMFASLTTLAYGLFKVFGGIKMMFMSMRGAIGSLAMSYGGLIPMVRTFAITLVGLYAVGKLLTSGNSFLITLGLLLAYVLGPIGWVTAAIVMLSAGFKEWQNFMNGGTSLGAFGKIAGVLQGIWEIMQNLTNDGWTMNAAMVKKLQDAGIFGIVQGIGTMISFVYRARTALKVLFGTLAAFWAYGQVVAGGMFMWARVVAIFTALSKGIAFATTALRVFAWALGIGSAALGWIAVLIGGLVALLAWHFLPEEWKQWGRDAMHGLWEGMKEVGSSIWEWIKGFGASLLPEGVSVGEGGWIQGAGFKKEENTSTSYTPSDYMKDNGSDMRETQATQLRGAMSAINIQQASSQGLQDQNINVFLDGDLMYSKMKDKGAFEQARYG